MWLLALMILIMPFEASPYLYIAPNFLGVFPDFTVIKLLGLVGFAWAMMRLASGHPHAALPERPLHGLAGARSILHLAGVIDQRPSAGELDDHRQPVAD